MKITLMMAITMDGKIAKNDKHFPDWTSPEEKKLKELEEMGYAKALLGGGAFLNTTFLEKKLIDEIIVTVEPKIFGSGISLFGGDFNIDLKLLEVNKINKNTVILKYKVVY